MARIDMSLDDSLAKETLCQIRVLGGEWPVQVEIAIVTSERLAYEMPRERVAFAYGIRLPKGATNEQCRDLLCDALTDLAKQIKDELWRGWEGRSV